MRKEFAPDLASGVLELISSALERDCASDERARACTRGALDNDAAERALCGVVLGRKNHDGCRSERGIQYAPPAHKAVSTASFADAQVGPRV